MRKPIFLSIISLSVVALNIAIPLCLNFWIGLFCFLKNFWIVIIWCVLEFLSDVLWKDMYSSLFESPVMEKVFFVLKMIGVLSSTEMRSCETPPPLKYLDQKLLWNRSIWIDFESPLFMYNSDTIQTIQGFFFELFAKLLFSA